jgi:DNA-binding NarL/FixJ family response regulator
MDIAIIDKSELSTLRIGSIVSGVKGLKSIHQIMDPGSILDSLGKIKPEVIIYDLSINGSENFSNLKKIKEILPDSVIITLTSFSLEHYREKCSEIGIRYCLDKNNEFDRIPGIISGIG